MEIFCETASQQNISSYHNASVSELRQLVESTLNNGDFSESRVLLKKCDHLLNEKYGIILATDIDQVAALFKNLRNVHERSLLDELSALLYAAAFVESFGFNNYEEGYLLFFKTHQLLERFAEYIEEDLQLKQRVWRAAYHIGLCDYLLKSYEQASIRFKAIEETKCFGDVLDKLDNHRLVKLKNKASVTWHDDSAIPSDVVSGVLFYSAECFLKLEEPALALRYMRSAAALEGNPVSAGFSPLASSRLSECYEELIKKSKLGRQKPITTTPKVLVNFKNAFAYEATRGNSKKSRQTTTAIIPVYNGGAILKTTLASVMSQTVPPSELIIIDDGSHDDSHEILLNIVAQNNFKCDVVLISTHNGGQSRARNLATELASSELIAFLDQDDLWYPTHIEKLVAPFRKNRSLCWTYSNLDEIDFEGRMIHRNFLHVVAPNRRFNNVKDLIQTDMFILPSASLIKRSALLLINGFDEELSGYEDDDLFIRLFRAGFQHQFIDHPLSQWRIHKNSCSYQMRMVISRRKFQQKLTMMYPNDPQMGRYWVRDYISPRFFHNGANRFNVGIECDDAQMCVEALEDMRTSAKTMEISISTRIKLFLCRFPSLMRRLRKVRNNFKTK